MNKKGEKLTVDLVVLFLFAIVFLVLLFMASKVSSTQEEINEQSGFQGVEMLMQSLMNYKMSNSDITVSEFLSMMKINFSDPDCTVDNGGCSNPYTKKPSIGVESCYLETDDKILLKDTLKEFFDDIEPFKNGMFLVLEEGNYNNDYVHYADPVFSACRQNKFKPYEIKCSSKLQRLKLTNDELKVPVRTAKIPIINEGNESNLELVLCYAK